MAGTQPVAVYAMKVPPGDVIVPASPPDFSAMFRVSMAAIDPNETALEDVDYKYPPRATLKLVRFPPDILGDSDDDEESDDEDEDEDDEMNGGPSDKFKKTSGALGLEADDEELDDEASAKAILAKLKKGKAKSNGVEDEETDEDDESEDSWGPEEVVICTLDPQKQYQQPIDIVVGEDERIYFMVSGTHTVHLTGNYVIPLDDDESPLDRLDEDEYDEYDLSPDEDELEDEDMESDELDDIADPRIMDIDTDEEETPKLVKAAAGKSKNKRPAVDSDEDGNLDDIIAKSMKSDAPIASEPKLSQAQLKKLKKQKKNDGEAKTISPESTKAQANGEKKVQFAKNLEQGPTPSPTVTKDAKKKDDKVSAGTTGTLGAKNVQGVTVDDKKLGRGPAAKKGDRVGMRYIGKLENGKVFDSNKKGKPFQFKLGTGEVIKGWDIGVAGLAVGGERRITIPAHLGYGSKGAPPDIPPNSKLVFDVKLLEIK